jgi:hypothetical protein
MGFGIENHFPEILTIPDGQFAKQIIYRQAVALIVKNRLGIHDAF